MFTYIMVGILHIKNVQPISIGVQFVPCMFNRVSREKEQIVFFKQGNIEAQLHE